MEVIKTIICKSLDGGDNHRQVFRPGSRHNGINGYFFYGSDPQLGVYFADYLFLGTAGTGKHPIDALASRSDQRQSITPAFFQEQLVELLHSIRVSLSFNRNLSFHYFFLRLGWCCLSRNQWTGQRTDYIIKCPINQWFDFLDSSPHAIELRGAHRLEAYRGHTIVLGGRFSIFCKGVADNKNSWFAYFF